ncbi:hypothetical protein L3X38_000092 [Prunus dulcis]|uniref:Uncharacterized protein n=1 Tax=Prunus dulcis TaxID=3755 RepID=A0AAD4USI1_PRUDU|nr:hypothetical protein L3X38_000092 [Prunus dulcis]
MLSCSLSSSFSLFVPLSVYLSPLSHQFKPLKLGISNIKESPYLWKPRAFEVERYKDKVISGVEVERGDSSGSKDLGRRSKDEWSKVTLYKVEEIPCDDEYHAYLVKTKLGEHEEFVVKLNLQTYKGNEESEDLCQDMESDDQEYC